MKQILLALLSLLLSGCAGLAVGSFGTFEEFSKTVDIPDRNRFSETNQPLAKADVIAALGKPDKESKVGPCDVLTYYDGYSWSGIGAFALIIPIPLLLPSGHDEQHIYFRDGIAVGEVSEFGEVSNAFGFMCGSNECGFVAGRANTELTKHAMVPECEQEP